MRKGVVEHTSDKAGGAASRLSERQTGLLALGGTIGAGLFLSVGDGLRLAGAGLPLMFAAGALLTFVVTRALGELALTQGGRVTFVALSATFLGRRAAFVQGWGYWMSAILACMAQLTALSLFARELMVPVPAWTVAPLALILLALINRLDLHLFGSIEAWLASMKVAVLAAVVLLGCAALASPGVLRGAGAARAFREAWPLPAGAAGLVASVPLVLFAFGNSELVVLASADLDNAAGTLAGMIRRFVGRLAALHVGVAVALLLLLPRSALSSGVSPFALLLDRAGVPGGGRIMNGVLILVMLSSCNACLYGAARVLHALAAEGCAPSWLARRAENSSPARAIGVSMLAVAAMTGLTARASASLFSLLLGAAATFGLINWMMFLVAHWRLRSAIRRSANSTIIALAGIAMALLAIGIPPPLRLSALTALVTLACLALLARLSVHVRQEVRGTSVAPSPPQAP